MISFMHFHVILSVDLYAKEERHGDIIRRRMRVSVRNTRDDSVFIPMTAKIVPKICKMECFGATIFSKVAPRFATNNIQVYKINFLHAAE